MEQHRGLREAQGGKCFLQVLVKRQWSLVKVLEKVRYTANVLLGARDDREQ